MKLFQLQPFNKIVHLFGMMKKNAAIIDPGGNAEKLIQRIEELELSLKTVLLTHGHLDHVGAAEAIRDHFNIEIWGSQEEDRFLFESLPQQSQQFGLPYISAFTPDRWFNQEGEKIQLAHLPLKFFIFLVIHLAILVLLSMKKILPLLAMSFSKTVLVVQTSLVGISTP